MKHQDNTPTAPHCRLCITPVKQQGDVCPQCHPRYIAMGKVLIAYANKLEPILKNSPRKHISAPMRFVPDAHFYLKELDEPVPHEKWVITHRLTLISFDKDDQLQREHWYGHNIPSTFMAALIDQRFFDEPDYFVPVESWHSVLSAGSQSGCDKAKQGD